MGTDSVGRDILSRVIHGSRISIVVAAVALLIGGAVGVVIGMLSGYLGKQYDALIMRAADMTMAFPPILFALILAVTLGPSFTNVVIALAVVLWARYARVVRAETLTIKERGFIAQARVAGCSVTTILLRHIWPNVTNTVLVLLSLQVGWVIIMESSLSFLGAGIPPPTPTWGGMIAEGRTYIASAWWVPFFPGLAIALTVFAFNELGNWARDRLDPKLRQL